MKTVGRILLAMLLGISPIAAAEDLDAAKKALIDELLIVTGAANMGEMMAGTFVGQMTNVLKSTQPDLNPKAYDILAEEVNGLIHEEVSERNILNEMMYPIYHRHLLSADISELIRFYKTAVGRKVIDTMPLVFQESTVAGQKWGESLGPEIQRRIMERFEKEGIELK